MALASGLGGQLGIAAEPVSGTFVPPTSFLTFLSEGLELKIDYDKIAGIRPDVLVQQDGLHVQTTRHVEGTIQPVPMTAGLGPILNALTGAAVVPTGADVAKTYVFPIGETAPDGKAFSVQVGVPGTDGVVQAKSVIGAVIESITFKVEAGKSLTCEATIWASDMDTTKPLAAATYPASAEAFSFLASLLQLDAGPVGSCVKSCSITFAFPKAKDRYCLNGSGTGLEPITNGQIGISGDYEIEFSGGWAQYDAYRNSTRRALSLKCSGTRMLEAATPGSIEFVVPQMVVEDNGTPVVSGPDLISTTASWTAVSDGAAPAATITYVTADTSL